MINFSEIRDIMEDIRRKYFGDKETDPNIYYMNGNDGTEFDFSMNNRLCEFYIFNKDGDGLIKLFANSDDTYEAYIYDYDDPYNGKYEKKFGNLSLNVKELATYLYAEKDMEDIYDAPITKWTLNRSVDFTDGEEDEWEDDGEEWEDDEDYWDEDEEEYEDEIKDEVDDD